MFHRDDRDRLHPRAGIPADGGLTDLTLKEPHPVHGAATALLIAPAAMHRVIYRRRLKQHLVRAASRLALAGLVLLLLSLVSAVLLIMDVVLGLAPALALAAAALAWFTLWWFVLPLRSRARELDMDDHAPDRDQPAALR